MATFVSIACAPAAPTSSVVGQERAESRPTRTLSVLVRNEPLDLTDSLSSRANFAVAMFGSSLVKRDGGVAYPVLSSVPELNTDTWRVSPDGRMETTYHLKPGLVWHDGQPLTAEDLVFGRQVTAARVQYGLSITSIGEYRAIDEVLATAPDVAVIRWRQPYTDAASPSLKPLPKHLLESALERAASDPQALGSHPYWTNEFIGLGPYRLSRWERGAFLEGSAFDQYVLGRPKIDRIVLSWSGDPNVTVSRLLSKDGHITLDIAVQFEQAVTLRREWNTTKEGVLILSPSEVRFVGSQLRPAHANPRAILDPRVRRASIAAIDRKAVADAMLEGEGLVAENAALPSEPYYEALDRLAAKHPYDLRRVEDLMRQAGFSRGADGLYSSSDEGRFAPEVLGIAEGQEGKETTVIADYFRSAGFDAQLRLVPSVQIQSDDELKATYPSWRTNYNSGSSPGKFYGPDIASPDNKWAGGNKIGWSNPEYDRLVEVWRSALDPNDGNQAQIQIFKIINDELPILPLYYNFTVVAHTADLQGPKGAAPQTTIYGNLHEWQWLK